MAEVVEYFGLFEVQAAVVDVLGCVEGNDIVAKVEVLHVPALHIVTNEQLVFSVDVATLVLGEVLDNFLELLQATIAVDPHRGIDLLFGGKNSHRQGHLLIDESDPVGDPRIAHIFLLARVSLGLQVEQFKTYDFARVF